MIRKVISYFNKQLGFYEGIKMVENQSNDDITGSCKRYLQMCPINECPPCVGREIRIIGLFDDENIKAPLISYEEPVIIADCDSILSVRFPSLYEQDGGKTN